MSVPVHPAIEQQFEQNAAERRTAVAEVARELRARQEQIAEQIKSDERALAELGKQLTESTKDEPPAPVRRPEDNDISAKAEAYQEPDEDAPEPPAPVTPPRPVQPAAVEDEEVPSFQWDDDSSAPAAPAPQPSQPSPPAASPPARRARSASRDSEEDLSEHDWLE